MYDFLEKVKLYVQETHQWLPGAAGKEEWLTTKGSGKVLGVDGTVLYFDCGNGYMTVYNWKKSQNCTLRRVKLM